MRRKDVERDHEIARLYTSGQYLTEQIAHTFGLSRRRVQQIAQERGVLRTKADANRVATPLKRKRRIRKSKTHYTYPAG